MAFWLPPGGFLKLAPPKKEEADDDEQRHTQQRNQHVEGVDGLRPSVSVTARRVKATAFPKLHLQGTNTALRNNYNKESSRVVKGSLAYRPFFVLKHFVGLLEAAALLHTLPLNVPFLQLFQESVGSWETLEDGVSILIIKKL